MSKKTSYTLGLQRRRAFGDDVNLGLVHFNTLAGNYMTLHNALLDHEMALFPIQH
jgi:hypothetical protein